MERWQRTAGPGSVKDLQERIRATLERMKQIAEEQLVEDRRAADALDALGLLGG